MISIDRAREIGDYANKYGADVAMEKYQISEDSLNRYIRLYRKSVAQVPQSPKDVTTVQDALLFGNTDAFPGLNIQSVKVNTWGKEGNENKQVTIKLAPTEDTIDVKSHIEEFKEHTRDYVPVRYTPERRQIEHPKLYEINISDAHVGLLAWARESGEDYDVAIASKLYLDCTHYLLQKAPKDVERILLVAGNDFFNSDTIDNTTTKGTRQSEDGRFQKTFNIGWQTLVKAIDMCRELADVDVMIVLANHDFQRSYFLGEVLTAFYRNDNHVHIDNSPKYYKYYQFGKTLLGFSHGDGCKSENLPLLMATDQPKLWGETTYREFHIGHLHTSITKMYGSEVEKNGCKVVTIPSLASASDWIAKNGYRSLREAQSFTYDKEHGRLSVFSYRPTFTK